MASPRRTTWKQWLRLKAKKTKRFYRPCVEALEDRAIPALAGSLDSLFGVGGAAYAQFGPGAAQSYGIYRDNLTHAIYSVGFADNGPTNGNDIAVVRYNEDGSRDLSFGDQGKVLTTIGPGDDRAEDVIGANVAGEFKIIVVGESFNGTNYDIVVVRYNLDGSLDNSFDGDGIATVGFPGKLDDKAYRVVFDPTTGKTLVGGSTSPTTDGTQNEFALVRFNQDGSLDQLFGTNGRVTAQFGDNDSIGGLAVDTASGAITVGGTSSNATGGTDFIVARYGANGVLETGATGFGGGAGFVRVPAGPGPNNKLADLEIVGSDQIVIAGTVQNGTTDFALFRLNADGTPDGGFGVGGRATIDAGQDEVLNDIAIDGAGNIVAVGTTHVGTTPNDHYNTVVARFTPTGQRDDTFGTNGVSITQLSTLQNAADDAQGVAIDDAGGILVAGHSPLHNQTDVFDLLRFVPNTVLGSTLIATPDTYTIGMNQKFDVSTSGFLGPFANDTIVSSSPVVAIFTIGTVPGTITTTSSDGGFIFTPPNGFSGTVVFTYMLSNGSTTSGPAPIRINVQALNSAPIVAPGATPLTTIPEDFPDLSNQGDQVSDILANSGYSDPDSSAQSGIAITHVDTIGGVWQFSADQTTWTNFPTIPAGSALHLFSSSYVRFLANPDANGTAKFDFKAWDQSNISSAVFDGQVAPITAAGGSSPYSAVTRGASVTITEVNDPPQARDDSLPAIAEDSSVLLIPFSQLFLNDSPGPDNEIGQAFDIAPAAITGAFGGSVFVDVANKRIEFTPTPDYYGSAGFTYTMTDNGTTNGNPDPLASTSAEVVFSISDINDAPVAADDMLGSGAGGPIDIAWSTLFANDSAGPLEDGDQLLAITSVDNAVGGTVSFSTTNQTVTFTPDPTFVGTASFTYTVTDDGTTDDRPDPLTATATVSFIDADLALSIAIPSGATPVVGDMVTYVVTVVNNGPDVAHNVILLGDAPVGGAATSAQGTPPTVSGGSISWSVGTLNSGQTASLQFTVQAIATGSLSFFASISADEPDPNTGNNEAFASARVGNISVAPLTIAENQPAGTVVGAIQSSDVEGTRLTLSIIAGGADFAIDATGPGNPRLVSRRAFNFETEPTRTVQISGASGADVYFKTFTINVQNANDAPKALDQTFNGAEDQPLVISIAALLATASDEDAGDTIFFVASGLGSAMFGSPSIDGNGNIVYQPNADFFGSDFFTYTITDDVAATTATIFVNIGSVNDAPVAKPDSASPVPEDTTTVTVDISSLLANDVAGPANESPTLTFVGIASVQNGTVTMTGTTIDFHPNADFNGVAGFTYTIRDDSGDTADGTFTVFLTDVNDAPVGVDDNLAPINEDGPTFAIDVGLLLGNDLRGPATAVDEVGQTLTFVGVNPASVVGGTLTFSGSTILFTPTPEYSGPAGFSYDFQDDGKTGGSPNPKSGVGNVRFAINEVNDPPTGADDFLPSLLEDAGPIFIKFSDLLFNDSAGPTEESNQTLTIINVGGATGGTVSLDPSGFVVFTPAANYFGPAGFVYTLQDNGVSKRAPDPKTATASVGFGIQPVNDAPLGGDDTLADIAEDSAPLLIPLAPLFGNDAAGPPNEVMDTLTFLGIGSAFGGTAVLSGGNVIFTPTPDYNGPAGFAYFVQDDGFTQDSRDPKTATFFVRFNVTPVNDPPTVQDKNFPELKADFAPFFFTWTALFQNATTGPANEAGQILSGVAAFSAVGGTVVALPGGVLFTPTAGYSGPASFIYLARDNGTTGGTADPQAGAGTVRFSVIRSTSATPPVATTSATSQSSAIPPRQFDGTVGAMNTVVASDTSLAEFGDSLRPSFSPGPLGAGIPAWGSLDSRLTVITQAIQLPPGFRPANQTISLSDVVSGPSEAPRRGQLLQIVNSQFDGEDNVWIIEGILRDLRPGPSAIRPATLPPPGSPNPAPPAPPEQSSWLRPIKEFGVGLMLFAGVAANMAFGPLLGGDVVRLPERKKPRKRSG